MLKCRTISQMVWYLQFQTGQLMTTGYGKIDAKPKTAMQMVSTLRTLLSKQAVVSLDLLRHPRLAIILMAMLALPNQTMNATDLVTAAGAGQQTTPLSGLRQMRTADANPESY